MGTLPELPEWLPEPVRKYVESRSQAGQPPDLPSDLMVRLATDQRMKPVWETLNKHAKGHAISDDRLLGSFFVNALYNVTYWKILERTELLLPAGERGQPYKNIRETIDDLIHLLNAYKKIRETIDNLVHLLNEEPTIDGIAEDIQRLHALRDRIEGDKVYSEYLPTKMRGDTAMRSFFMRVMKDFVLRFFGHPLHEAIAHTTNVVFNTDDVTSDHVRKA